MSSPAPSFAPGDVIADRYRVEEVIGAGGFGVVLRARQLRTERQVALKVLRPGLLDSLEGVKRFEREAQLVQRLDHPNTVRLLDFGRAEGGAHFIAFELLRGRPLNDVLRGTNGLPGARIARIAAQVLKSLMEAHGHGIIHRDVKPSNIFLCEYAGESDFVKLLDFGIAKSITGDAAATALTQEGLALGTPSYMAPEQITGRGVGPASDLYALGLVMAEMITGQPVFAGPSSIEICARQLSADPAPLPRAALQHPLGPIVLRATQKAPDWRYASASEMLAHLASLPFAADADSPAQPTTMVQRMPGAVGQPLLPAGIAPPLSDRRSSRLGPGAVAALVLGTLVVVGGLGGIALLLVPALSTEPGPITEVDAGLAGETERVASTGTAADAPPPLAAEIELTIRSTPRNVDVFAGSERLGTSAAPLRLKRADAPIKLTFKAPGFVPAEITVTPTANAVVSVTLVRVSPRRPGTVQDVEF